MIFKISRYPFTIFYMPYAIIFDANILQRTFLKSEYLLFRRINYLLVVGNWPFFFSFNEWCSKKDRHNQFLNPPAWPHNHQISYWDMRNMPEGLIFFWIIREVCTRSSELFYLVPCSYLELYEFFLKFIMIFYGLLCF